MSEDGDEMLTPRRGGLESRADRGRSDAGLLVLRQNCTQSQAQCRGITDMSAGQLRFGFTRASTHGVTMKDVRP